MRPGEPATSYADIEKARRILDWTPAPLAVAIDRDLLADEKLMAAD
jgi:UDP-glucose 4-epimerase